MTNFVTFDLKVNINCLMKTVTAPATVDQFYKVNDALSGYEVDPFFNSEPVYCPLTYTFDYETARLWLAPTSDRAMSWYTD